MNEVPSVANDTMYFELCEKKIQNDLVLVQCAIIKSLVKIGQEFNKSPGSSPLACRTNRALEAPAQLKRLTAPHKASLLNA